MPALKRIFLYTMLIMPFILSAQKPDIAVPRNIEEFEVVFNKTKNGTSEEKAKSRYIMGYCFQNGILAEKDMDAAIGWYIMSTADNYIPSWLALAHIYEETNDPVASLRSYYQAALLGSEAAEKELTDMFDEDDGGDILAGHFLSRLYRERGDISKFMPVANSNSAKGDIVIQAELGEYLMDKGNRDMYLTGFNLYEKIAASDSIQVMHNMADELGVAYDDDNLHKWYEKYVNETLTKVWSGLGLLYLDGTPYTESDHRKAVKLLEKAAANNDTDAMYGLVRCYSEGLGVKKDTGKVEYWNNMIEENEDSGTYNYLAIPF